MNIETRIKRLQKELKADEFPLKITMASQKEHSQGHINDEGGGVEDLRHLHFAQNFFAEAKRQGDNGHHEAAFRL